MSSVLDVVLPVFLLILVGFAFARSGTIGAAGTRALGTFVFAFAIPVLLFRAGAGLTGGDGPGIDGGVLASFYAGAGLTFVAALVLGRLAFRQRLAERAMFATSATYSNSVMVGIPLAVMLWGDAGLALASAIIALSSIAFYGSATVLVAASRGGASVPGALARTILALARNPIIVGMLAGLAWGAGGLDLPQALDRLVELVAAAAPAVALFTLGTTLPGLTIAGDVRQVGAASLLKLLVQPGLTWLLGRYVFAVEPLALGVATLFAALPTAANAYILAQQHGIGARRASGTVLVTTALAAGTVAVTVALLGRGS